MADSRTFTLIGEFQDGITPQLAKINDSLNGFKRNMASMTARKGGGFSDVTQSVGKLVSAQKHLANAIKEVGDAARGTTTDLKGYRQEVGKVARAHYHIAKSGEQSGAKIAKEWQAAATNLDAYQRRINRLQTMGRGFRVRNPQTPYGGGGGGMQPPRVPRGGGAMQPPRAPRGGGGGAGGGPGGFHMAEFGFAYTLGSSIAQPIQNAIVQGFQIGVGFMTKPFQYFAGAFGERVQDQLSDLKAAGGLLSVSKRSKSPFLANMEEAIQYQQDTNQVFAKMAGSLPGVTNDYVQVGKRLSDTMARITSGDFQNALIEANKIRATEEGRKFYGEKITGTGAQAQRDVMTTLLGEMTKQTTLAGLGGRSGAGGIAGAYGLPGLTERMLSQQEVSMGQFQRYAAVFSDPTIQDALSRNVDLINKTLPNTTARFRAMKKLLEEVVTPEMIDKLRTSVDGVYQGLKASLFDPDTGLFGLGRQFKAFGKRMNSYGQYLDKANNVVKTMAEAAPEDLSIFEMLANIFSNIGQVLQPIVDFLPTIFDPLRRVASILKDVRYYSGELARTFNTYRESLMKLSETKEFSYLKGTIDLRAALGAINNMMRALGVISKADFASTGKMLMSKDFDPGKAISEMLDKLLNSEVATSIGRTIGEIIGTVLVEVAKVTGLISGRLKQSNKLFEGLKQGFESAGGSQAFKAIFRDIFLALGNALLLFASVIPPEGYILAAAMLVLPAAVQGLAMALAQGVVGGLGKLTKMCSPMLAKSIAGAGCGLPGIGGGPGGRGGKNRLGRNLAAGFMTGTPREKILKMREAKTRRAQAMEAMRGKGVRGFASVAGGSQYTSPIGPLPKAFAKGPGGAVMASQLKGLPKALKGITAFGKVGLQFAKKLPGLSVALGALDFGLRKAAGQGNAEAGLGAVGATIGSIGGGVLGSALGPAGTVGGAVAGAAATDCLFYSIGKQIDELPKTLEGLPSRLNTAITNIKEKLVNLPEDVAYSLGFGLEKLRQQKETTQGGAGNFLNTALQSVQNSLNSFGAWFMGLGPKFYAWVAQAKAAWDNALANFGRNALAAITGKVNWGALATSLSTKISTTVSNAFNSLQLNVGGFIERLKAAFARGGADAKPPKPGAKAYGEPGKSFGSLHRAIAYENRHKPPGSSLVIANSSETVIPAASGYAPNLEKMSGTQVAGLLDGLFGKKPPQLKPGQKPTMSEFGTKTGHDLMHRKNTMEEAIRKMRGGVSSNAGPSTPIKWDDTMKQYVPNPGAGRPGNVRYKGFPMQASAVTMPTGGMYSGGGGGKGGTATINAPITINQQPGQDSEQLAAVLASHLNAALEQAVAANVYGA